MTEKIKYISFVASNTYNIHTLVLVHIRYTLAINLVTISHLIGKMIKLLMLIL